MERCQASTHIAHKMAGFHTCVAEEPVVGFSAYPLITFRSPSSLFTTQRHRVGDRVTELLCYLNYIIAALEINKIVTPPKVDFHCGFS